MSLDEARKKAEATYNAAADRYDSNSNTFWSRFGVRTIERLRLRPGDTVLDVCCGSGASALPAARTVGPQGRVVGVDLADNLLELARTKARRDGFHHAQFRTGDLLSLALPEAPFDAVVCVFGIFFVPDMTAGVRALWQNVRPGGTLAITTWGPRWFEPISSVFWNAVREVRPDLYRGFNPWDRITDSAALLGLFEDAGISGAVAVAESALHPVPTPDALWDGVLGSGCRGTLEQLSDADRSHVQRACFKFCAINQVTSLEVNVVYATAKR